MVISLAFTVRFTQPWWLIALASAGVPVVVALWASRRGRHIARASVALQVLAVALAAAALARPEAPLSASGAKPYLVLHDVSASTGPQGSSPLDWPNWPENLPRESYVFAATVARAGAGGQRPNPDATNLAPALRLAWARLEQLAGVVIHTDGQFQDADWPAAAGALGGGRARVVVVPMDSPPADGRVADLAALRKPDGTVAIRVTVATNAHMDRTLVVTRRGLPSPLLERGLRLLAEAPATIRLSDPADRDRAAVYTARLSPADEFAGNDTATAVALPRSRRVAFIAADSQPVGANLARSLGGSVVVVAPGEAPDGLSGWLDYCAVVLVDAEGTLLGAGQRAALARYVRSGGGLVLAGAGPRRTPGDREDPLNQVAALVANPFQRRPMRVIVALDASGSMAQGVAEEGRKSGRIKFDAAIEAVLSLKRHLTGRDRLSVITFSETAELAYDSAEAGPDFAAVRDVLGRIRPSGATDVMKAVELATSGPRDADRLGLVILVSDLLPTRPFDPGEAERMFRRSGLGLAVVATEAPGERPDGAVGLERLTEALEAPLVTRRRLTGLAAVFADFLRGFRGKAIRSGPFRVKGTGSVQGLPVASMPPIEAYLLCGAQKDAEVVLSLGEDPLLAQRRVGLGHSVGLAVPLTGKHNPSLLGSRYIGDLLAAAVRWAMRPDLDPRFSGRLVRAPGRLEITVTAEDEQVPMNRRELSVRVTYPSDPAAGRLSARLLQTAPGRYEAEVAVGAGAMAVVVHDEEFGVVWQDAPAGGGGRELDAIGPNWENLRLLSRRTGGRVVRPADLSQLTGQWDAGRYSSLWPVLLAAAVAIMLTEWCLTRVWRRGK